MTDSRIPKELHNRVFELTLALYRVTDFFPQGEVLRKNLREKANEVFSGIAEYDYSENREHSSVFIISKIQSLRGYLEIARSMRFVRPINITVLEREYDFLASFFSKELEDFRHDASNKNEVRVDIQSKESATAKKESSPEVTWEDFSGSGVLEDMGSIDNLDAVLEIKPEIKSKPKIEKERGELASIASDINERQKAILSHLKEKPQVKISDFSSLFTDISSKTIQRDLQDLVVKNVLKKQGEKRWTTYSLLAASDSVSDS